MEIRIDSFAGKTFVGIYQTHTTSLEMKNDPSKWISVKLVTFFVICGSKFLGFCYEKLLLNFLSWLNFIMSLGLKTHLEDAQKMKEQEQADYVQKIVRWFYNCGSILQLRQIILLTYTDLHNLPWTVLCVTSV